MSLRNGRLERLQRYLPHALLAIVLVLGLATVRDYGITSDEPLRAAAGDNWLRFIATLDRRYLPSGRLASFAPLVDILGALATKVVFALGGTDRFLGRHLVSFAFGWVGLLGTYRLGRRIMAPAAATLALLLLVLVPRYYGASFDNPKDIPFAAGFVWAMLGVVRVLQEPTPRNAALCGLLAAVCTTIRAFGVLFVGVGFLACLIPLTPTPSARRGRLALLLVACAVAATIALWPLLWVTPPWHVARAVLALAGPHPDLVPTPHLYFGTITDPYTPPPSYAAVWIAITLPLPTLALLLAGAGLLARRWRSVVLRRAGWVAGLGALWLLVPVLLPLLRYIPMHNAVRHFFFFMPGACLLAAYGAFALFELADLRWRRVLILAGAVGYGDVALTSIALHPYQDLYFSRIIGGLRGADGRFDTSYWHETIRECFLWLRDNKGSQAPVYGTWRVIPGYYAEMTGMRPVASGPGYFMSEVRTGREGFMPGHVVHAVEREGVPLAVVVAVTPLELPTVWSGALHRAWQPLEQKDGRFELDDGTLLAVTLASPKAQRVPIFVGYTGASRMHLQLGTERRELMALLEDPAPARVRVDLPFGPGSNTILIDPATFNRSRGLYIAYPGDLGLESGPAPVGRE